MSENKKYDFYLEKKLDQIFEGNVNNGVPSINRYNFSADLDEFHSGFALYLSGLKLHNYYNFKGERLLDEDVDRAYNFNHGYAIVGKYFEEFDAIKENLIDPDGNFVSDRWFDYVRLDKDKYVGYDLHDDIKSEIVSNNHYNVRFDINGNNGYELAGCYNSSEDIVRVQDFSKTDAYIRVEFEGKCNYRKPNRKFLLEEGADEISSFKDGYALVKNNGKYNLVDMDGNYVSKNEWFDSISHYEYFNTRGYVVVYKDNKFNIMDKNGDLLSSWLEYKKPFKPDEDKAFSYVIMYTDLKDYTSEKVGIRHYKLSNGSKTYDLKYPPIRVYDNYILCCKPGINPFGYFNSYIYYLYNKEDHKYYKIGCSIMERKIKGKENDVVVDCFSFDDNFIHDNFHKKTYLIYGSQIVEITDYYNKKLKDKRTVTVNKGLSKIKPLKEFGLGKDEKLDKEFSDSEEQERIRREQIIKDLKTKEIGALLAQYKSDEEGRQEAIRTLKDDIDLDLEKLEWKIDLLAKLETNGAKVNKLRFNRLYLFKNVDGHLEFRNSIIKNNRLHMFNTSQETFENVKMDHLQFEGCDLRSIEPTKVYKQDMSHSSFIGIHFNPLTKWTNVNIIGSTFTDDNDPLTMDVMPAFADAIYDDTTTYNGYPLTSLIKRDRMGLQEDKNEPEIIESTEQRRAQL